MFKLGAYVYICFMTQLISQGMKSKLYVLCLEHILTDSHNMIWIKCWPSLLCYIGKQHTGKCLSHASMLSADSRFRLADSREV